MKEEKMMRLAHTIVNYSLKLKKGSKVKINFPHEAEEFIEKIIDEADNVGAHVYLEETNARLNAKINEKANVDRIDYLKKKSILEVDEMDAFINIRYTYNDYEDRNVNKDYLIEYGKRLEEEDKVRIDQREWVLLNYPSQVDAYKSKMTTREFEDFAWDVMTVDYEQMSKDILPLKELMEKTDKVRIISPGTDLTFSIKDLPAIPCTGEKNIPDGELYTAPVKDSVNGTITYNTPSPYRGNVYNHVSLTFENGKIIKATCDEDDNMLNEIFNTDEGARYVGEFSLGFNPKILTPMGDILYDEKILGSLHFTPGKCYADCDNGNVSAIHWDMVLIQREDFGGGKIYFDDKLIRKDGKFVLDDLKQLNYENN